MVPDYEDQLSSTSTMSQDDCSQKFRTELCKYFLLKQECPFGSKCLFAHGEDELFQKQVSKNYRTKQCLNFSRESCKYGVRCQFAHLLSTPKLPVLRYWNNIENIQVGSMKKKHRLKIFKSITSGVYNKQKSNDDQEE